jgi:hypothetical protein
MTDVPGTQQQHKWTKYTTAVTSTKQEDSKQGLQMDPRPGDHKDSSRVFHQTPKNKCQDNVEEPICSQTKEETTDSYKVV